MASVMISSVSINDLVHMIAHLNIAIWFLSLPFGLLQYVLLFG